MMKIYHHLKGPVSTCNNSNWHVISIFRQFHRSNFVNLKNKHSSKTTNDPLLFLFSVDKLNILFSIYSTKYRHHHMSISSITRYYLKRVSAAMVLLP